MTMTTSDVTVQGVDTVVPAFTMPAGMLRDLLAGALVAVSKDGTLPGIGVVRVEWDEITPVTVASTDRWRLVTGTVADVERVRVSGAGAVSIDRATVADLVKSLPKLPTHHLLPAGGPVVTATVTGDHVVVRVDDPSGSGSWSREIRTVDAAFPTFRTLIPLDGPTEIHGISFNPSYLADVAKLPHWKDAPVSWTFHGSTRPALARYGTYHGVDWIYLLMPVRLP